MKVEQIALIHNGGGYYKPLIVQYAQQNYGGDLLSKLPPMLAEAECRAHLQPTK